MALNMVKAGHPVIVWNRSRAKCDRLVLAGARAAEAPRDVFAQCATVIMMLVDGAAIDAVLRRHDGGCAVPLKDRLIINMATTSPAYSKALEQEINRAGGSYLEAPVSGSRTPAEAGHLVAMLAGRSGVPEGVCELLSSMCRQIFWCGEVPSALQMKLAVNLFLTATVTGLAESMHFASLHKLDLSTWRNVLEASPLSSNVARVKSTKLVERDFEPQASIANVLTNVGLIADAARAVGAAAPVLDACHALYEEAQALGFGEDDMAAVVRAIEHRTARVSSNVA
mgnify:FL=1